MSEENQLKTKKVLFYTHTPRAFQTTLIGHLYEISQVYPTILLSEKLDSETERVLENKNLFPKLKKMIPVRQFEGGGIDLVKNRYLFNLAKDIIQCYKPNVVITAGDIYGLFELYLLRFAKRMKAVRVCIQPFLAGKYKNQIALWIDLTNAWLMFPLFLPLPIRMLLVKCRKYFYHFLFYWILPLMVGEKPFWGKSSYILHKGHSGMRDADYQIVFPGNFYKIYLEEGVPIRKLYILSHPLSREKTRKFFKKTLLSSVKKYRNGTKVVTILFPEEEIGFRRDNYSLISKEWKQRTRIETIKLVIKILSGWRIFIKPHPDVKNVNEIIKNLESLSANIKVIDPAEPLDRYIEISDVIVELSRSASTGIFTASLQCPEKPIISLDFHHEFLGDFYKDFKGIEYADTEEKFINILETIRDNKYQKKHYENKKELMGREYPNFIVLLEHLLREKYNTYDSKWYLQINTRLV